METEEHTAKKKWVTKVIRKEFKKFLESSENENTLIGIVTMTAPISWIYPNKNLFKK
jgi:hypothetical protein